MSFSTALIALLQTKAGTVGAFAAATTVAGLGVTSSVLDDAATDTLGHAEQAAVEVELPDLDKLTGNGEQVDIQDLQPADVEYGDASEVAVDVWAALTSDPNDAADEGLDPRYAEDDAFGQAVAKNAYEGGADFGLGVASAAQDAAAEQGTDEIELESEDDDNGGPPEGAGPPEDLPAPANP